MAINFPASPAPDDTYTANGVTYKWDGTSWLAQGVTGLYTLPTASDTNLGGVKVGENLELDSNDAIGLSEPVLYNQTIGTSSNPIILTVTYAAKTANNQFHGTGSADCFHINGIESPPLTLVVGKTYRFDLSDASNTGHEFRFFGREDRSFAQGNNLSNGTSIWFGRDWAGEGLEYGEFIVPSEDNNSNEIPAGTAGSYVDVTIHPRCDRYYYYGSKAANTTHTGNYVNCVGTQDFNVNEDRMINGLSYYMGSIINYDQFVNGGLMMHEVNNNTSSWSMIQIDVRVEDKYSSNQYYGQGSTKCYTLHVSGDSAENHFYTHAPHLTLIPGQRYRFNQDHTSNAGYPPLLFWTDKNATDTINNATSTQVQSYTGTPGQSGAYTDLVITDDTPGLIYYMGSGTGNELMGGMATCGTATGSGGGGGTPGGTDTQIQYNNNGAFGGTSSLLLTGGSDLQFTGDNFNCTWNKTLSSFAYADGAKAIFGSNTDLQIFHASNLTEIKGGNATPLKVSVDDITFANEAGNVDLIKATSTGVSLYHGGNAKVTTTAGGATITGALTAGGLTYPSSDGQSGEFLQTDGSGNLSWQSAGNSAISIDALTDVDVTSNAPQNNQVLKWNGTNWVPSDDLTGGGGGTGLTSRTTSSVATSGSHANGTAEDVTIGSVGKTYSLLKIQSSHAAWITLYTDTTARTNDASRTEYSDPLPGTGVIAEVITTDGQGQIITPAVIGFNNDPTPTENVYAKVVNKSGATRPITVTLTFVKLEA